ncbi:MAG TPA: phosphoribosyltransferase family protein [Flavisolibacter sp.]|jgi:pyrimidine operon attenuation protein/uracil phosphoribosyltransferase|nr:phosphoribosyltransferase family protein [Flavisolibacter sp.]
MESAAQTKNCVIDKESIGRKLKRMALEVAERNAEEREIVIAGINGNGEVVARCLQKELSRLMEGSLSLITIELNKKDPLEARLRETVALEGKVVIIVDDVANTGRTMLYALKPFLNAHPKKIQTLVLVERSHKEFPVQTDYTGLSISTTLQENIRVEAEGDVLTGAWLY